MAWGDYDNDGLLDILLTGWDSSSNAVAKVYHNDGSDTFHDIGAGLTGVGDSSVAWGDYDGDGRLDILLTGWNGSGIAKVYHNDGDGTFPEVSVGLVQGVGAGSVGWGDYDNDGRLDVLLTGWDGSGAAIAEVFRNVAARDLFADQGSLVPVGDLTYVVQFDEVLNAASLDAGDVQLVGQWTVPYAEFLPLRSGQLDADHAVCRPAQRQLHVDAAQWRREVRGPGGPQPGRRDLRLAHLAKPVRRWTGRRKLHGPFCDHAVTLSDFQVAATNPADFKPITGSLGSSRWTSTTWCGWTPSRSAGSGDRWSSTATGWLPIDGDTIRFTLPVLGEGVHTVTIAGAL